MNLFSSSTTLTQASGLEQGCLLALQGTHRGRLFCLGESGLVLTPAMEWVPPEQAEGEKLADLYRVGRSVFIDRHGGEVKMCGDPVRSMTPAPCNATIEVDSAQFRLFYVGENRQSLTEKEGKVRALPPFPGLLPPDWEWSPGVLQEVLAAIPPECRRFLARLGPDPALRYFLTEFARHPISVIRAENRALAEVADEEMRRSLARELTLGRARVEAALFPSSESKTAGTYDEWNNVLYFAQNDYLPGHRFVLGDESTYNREKLCIDKMGEPAGAEAGSPHSLASFFTASRMLAAEGGGDDFRAGLRIFFSLVDQFAPGPLFEENEVVTINIQNFFDQGGVCRHKCAVLQVALQEAGIPSRYLRGKLFFGGYHAWIEVDVFQDQSYSLILDPHLYHVLLKTEIVTSPAGDLYLVDEGYPVKPVFNTVWRGKPKK